MSNFSGRPDPFSQNNNQQQQQKYIDQNQNQQQYSVQDQSLSNQYQQSSYDQTNELNQNFQQHDVLHQPQMPQRLQVINESNFENQAFQQNDVNINGGPQFQYVNSNGVSQNQSPMPYMNQKQYKIDLVVRNQQNDEALGQLYCVCFCDLLQIICPYVTNCCGAGFGMCNECVDVLIANAGLCFDPMLNICQCGCQFACKCAMSMLS